MINKIMCVSLFIKYVISIEEDKISFEGKCTNSLAQPNLDEAYLLGIIWINIQHIVDIFKWWDRIDVVIICQTDYN